MRSLKIRGSHTSCVFGGPYLVHDLDRPGAKSYKKTVEAVAVIEIPLVTDNHPVLRHLLSSA